MKRFNMSSEQDLERARKLFWRCMTLLTGLQQPPHSPDEETARRNEEAQARGEIELRALAAILYEGITGESLFQIVHDKEVLMSAIKAAPLTHVVGLDERSVDSEWYALGKKARKKWLEENG